MAFGEAVGEAGGLGEAVAAAEAEGPFGGGFEGDEVAGGDVEWRDSGPRAEDEADDLPFVGEGDAGAGFGGERRVFAAKAALGDTYGGDGGEEADVGGDAEATGVGVALAIDEEKVRDHGELLEGPGEGGDFAEGEEAGDVGEGHRTLDDALFGDVEAGVSHEDGGGSGEAGAGGAPAAARAVDVGDVGGGDKAAIGGVAGADDSGGEAALEGDGFGGRQVPGVELSEAHVRSIDLGGCCKIIEKTMESLCR